MAPFEFVGVGIGCLNRGLLTAVVPPAEPAGAIGRRVLVVRREGWWQAADDAVGLNGHSHEALEVEDEVVRLVGPLVPAVRIVGDSGGSVGGDPESVDGPVQGGLAVDFV